MIEHDKFNVRTQLLFRILTTLKSVTTKTDVGTPLAPADSTRPIRKTLVNTHVHDNLDDSTHSDLSYTNKVKKVYQQKLMSERSSPQLN